MPDLRNTLSQRQRLKLFATTLAVGLILIVIVAMLPETFEKPDVNIYKALTRQRMRDRSPTEQMPILDLGQKIVLVHIDDASLQNLKLSWPVSRKVYAEMIRRLDLLGAKTIGLDLLFTEAAKDEADDLALTEAFKNPKVVLTYPLLLQEFDDLGASHPYAPLIEGWSEKDKERRLGFTADWINRGHRFATLRVNRLNRTRFYSLAATLLAHFRGIHPAEALEGLTLNTWYPVMQGIELQALGAQVNPVAFGLPNSVQGYQAGEATLGDVVQVLSLEDLLSLDEEMLNSDTLGPEFLALIGVTAKAGFDEKTTVTGTISGVELHINILFNLMQDSFVRDIPPATGMFLMLILVVALGAAGTQLAQKPFVAVSAGSLLMMAGLVRMLVLGNFGNPIWPPFFGPLFVLVALTILIPVLQGQANRAKIAKMTDVMKEICPAGDLEHILEEGLKAGGERRELTILFSDLRDYTTFVETHKETVDILDFLNLYYGSVSHIFERYGGVVLDYQGDAQMVVFGLVEESKPNHAAAAIKAGVEIILTLDRLREERRKTDGLVIPDTGVGICTGDVSFGVLGNARRKQYVAIGDPTNTAARLQGKSADIGERVLAARSSRVLAGGEVIMDFVDEIPLKGKKQTIGVFSAKVEEMLAKKMVNPAEGEDDQ